MIIYLHGTKTCGLDGNAKLFKEYFNDRLFTPTLSYVPSLAIDTIEQLIKFFLAKNENVALIGSSMGGYYAIYLANKYDIKAVLINPAIIPYKNLPRIGMDFLYYDKSSYEVTKTHLHSLKNIEVQKLKSPDSFLTLLQTGDKVLDYTIAQEKLKDTKLIIEEGGSHSFDGIERYFIKIDEFLDV